MRKPAGAPPVKPTRPRTVAAPQVGARQHSNTQQVPVVEDAGRSSVVRRAADRRNAGGRGAAGRGTAGRGSAASIGETVAGVRNAVVHVDPLIRRLSGLAIIVALCVPVAMSLRGSDGRTALQPDPSTLATGGGADATAVADQAITVEGADVTFANDREFGEDSDEADTSLADTTASTPAADATSSSDADTTQAPPSATQPKAVEVAVTAAATCTKKYAVVAGDYWILIAKKVSVTLKEVLAANNATTATALYPGRTVCLPANASAPTTAPPTTAKATTTTAKATTTTAKATTTTVKVTTTTAAPVKANYTKAEVDKIIRDIWPDDLENEAVRIATRESNLVPSAKNYCCYGLFQVYWNVHKSWLIPMGVTNSNQLFDPRVNAYVALSLYYRAGGWGPWR